VAGHPSICQIMCIQVAIHRNLMTRQYPVAMNQNQALIPDQAIAVNHHLQALQVLLVEQPQLGELRKSSRRRKKGEAEWRNTLCNIPDESD